METPHTGYRVQSYSQPVKRYCQTLNLKENPELIAEYRKRHLKENAWPEILEGIREVGILEMEIYILGSRLFMIVETPVIQEFIFCCENFFHDTSSMCWPIISLQPLFRVLIVFRLDMLVELKHTLHLLPFL